MMRRYVDPDGAGAVDLSALHPPIAADGGQAMATIEGVYVVPGMRRRGIGGELLRRALADADREGVALYLDVVPSGEMGDAALRAWYARHGFVARPGHMWRPPRPDLAAADRAALDEIARDGENGRQNY